MRPHGRVSCKPVTQSTALTELAELTELIYLTELTESTELTDPLCVYVLCVYNILSGLNTVLNFIY